MSFPGDSWRNFIILIIIIVYKEFRNASLQERAYTRWNTIRDHVYEPWNLEKWMLRDSGKCSTFMKKKTKKWFIYKRVQIKH